MYRARLPAGVKALGPRTPFRSRNVAEVRTSCYMANASILDHHVIIRVSFYENKGDASEGVSASRSAIKDTPPPSNPGRKALNEEKNMRVSQI